MLTLVLRGFVQRKLRVLLTAVAIALGVALMAGTYILTDTINHAFAGIFHAADENKSVIVTPTETLGENAGSETSPIDEAMLARVRAVPGVALAAGATLTPGSLLSLQRKRLSVGKGGAFISSVVPARFESFQAVSGRLPQAADEVALDEATAAHASLKLGQQVLVAGAGATRRYTLVGTVAFAGGQSFAGASIALLIPGEAQLVAGERGLFAHLDVAAQPGVTASELRARIRAALPGTVTVRTGAEQAASDTANLESDLSFLRTFLLVFAYVAVAVGAFIIFNTFSITVAQRTREFGLLRTLGASRAQVMRSVIAEGLLLGVVGAALGLLGGIVLAPALDGLFKAFGADLPDNGTVLETRTVVVALLVGVGVTVLAGLAPALRATRVPPLAAMREGVQIPPRPLPTRRTLVVRFVIGLLAILALGPLTGAHLVLPVLLVLWCARAVRLWVRLRRGGERPARHYRVVPALAGAIGLLVSWRGITARLARENSIRQPGRTLVTAGALAVGLALVTFVAVLADGATATIEQAEGHAFTGSLIVENSQKSAGVGVPAAVAPALRTVPGVASVTAIAFTQGRLRGSSSNLSVTAVEPSSIESAYRVEWQQGTPATLRALDATGTILSKSYASSQHLKAGERISVLTPAGRYVSLTVRGVAQDKAGLLHDLTITRALARSAFGQREDALNLLTYAPGASNAQVQPAVDRLLAADFPQLRSQTAAQFEQEQSNEVNTSLELIYVLLALSVVVSLFGIVNTLILSIYERTRELGMLRAIGASRRQIRQMIRYESLITALIGGVLGLAVGVVGAILVATLALSGSGYVLSVPVGTLVVLLLLAALAGLLAAQLPARRAARLDVLGALASE
jgi:putative ABC transport system permease protein